MNGGTHDLIYWAIPFFLALMAFEWLILGKRRRDAYHLGDTLCNVSCGLGLLAFEALIITGAVIIYESMRQASPWPVFGHAAWVSAPWVRAGLLFVLIDLQYYAYHRISHSNRYLWSIHVVHHQSESFNFSVGLRQAWFQKLTSIWFYLPLALLGFEIEIFAPVLAAHACLQIWTHTEAFNAPKWLEWILVTPALHKLHHGRNAPYIDCNYGGIFSVWDRLSGTLRKETEPVVYGALDWTPSNNPFVCNLRPIWAILRPRERGQKEVQQPEPIPSSD